ncbi:MAG: UDP-3-O-(3-hydroxymyristoyl)glucosamine N-acyltransferase, partial [Chitinophagaceae bacterium]
ILVKEYDEAIAFYTQNLGFVLIEDTMISDSAVIGEGSFLFPNVFVGHNVQIGSNCILYPNVSILDHCIIGDNVIIQAGTVIGGNSFYYNGKKDRKVWYKKMPDCGRVIIEDEVEIGANCTIDRGVSHDTVIGRGTKMDNMIHVGHDTIIGKNGLFAAQSAIAGVVNIGDGVTVWGQCGINKTLSIGDNVTLLAMSGVGGNLEAGKIYWGAPAEEASIKKRELVWIKRIPALWEKVMKSL